MLFGGSKHLVDPLLTAAPAPAASEALIAAMDLAAYLVLVPLSVAIFRRCRETPRAGVAPV